MAHIVWIFTTRSRWCPISGTTEFKSDAFLYHHKNNLFINSNRSPPIQSLYPSFIVIIFVKSTNTLSSSTRSQHLSKFNWTWISFSKRGLPRSLHQSDAYNLFIASTELRYNLDEVKRRLCLIIEGYFWQPITCTDLDVFTRSQDFGNIWIKVQIVLFDERNYSPLSFPTGLEYCIR